MFPMKHLELEFVIELARSSFSFPSVPVRMIFYSIYLFDHCLCAHHLNFPTTSAVYKTPRISLISLLFSTLI